MYVLDACAEAREAIDALALVVPLVRRVRGRDGHARLHAPPARAADHARAPPARVGRDARPRPHALRRRRRGGRREPARRRRARRLDARASSPAAPDAQLDRRRRRPRLRARLPVRGGRPLHAPLAHRRGDRALGDLRVRLRPASGDGGDGVVDDAAEAQPGRRRARARQGGDGDRPAHRACSRP